MIPVLISWAQEQRSPQYYGTLSKAIGHGTARIGKQLYVVDKVLSTLSDDAHKDVPLLNALLINKGSRRPSDGLDAVLDGYKDWDEKMKRLNNAFGIGIIEMQATEAKMLYQAREKQLDYNTIEKLNNLSPDFRTFIAKLSKVLLASKDYTADARKSFESICDKVFDTDEEIATYCKEHSIPY